MNPPASLSHATITWLGSSAFRLASPGGKLVYLDPWLENQDCPASERFPDRVDLVVLTHGHFDHVGQTIELWERHRPAIVAPQDLRHWLERQGLERDDRLAPDKGGTVKIDGISISLTDARHSGGAPDGGYGGAACGCVLRLEDGLCIYFAGDTCVFGDMQLIGRMHRPDIAVLLVSGFSAELLGSGPEAALGWELLPKPYDRTALARAIAKVLSR